MQEMQRLCSLILNSALGAVLNLQIKNTTAGLTGAL